MGYRNYCGHRKFDCKLEFNEEIQGRISLYYAAFPLPWLPLCI